MAHDNDFEDLGYGDETRRNGDYVGLPVDETDSADVEEGDVVAIGGNGTLVQANDADDLEPIGVLYTYQYYHDAENGSSIDYDRDATVKTSGTVKARILDGVTAGTPLKAGSAAGTDSGVFAGDGGDPNSNFVALMDATEDADGNQYAEVLLR